MMACSAASRAETGTTMGNHSGDLCALTLHEAAEKLRQREVSSAELTEACLARIEQWNPLLNAFITITAADARRDAKNADREIASGNYRGPLHGIPIALKDLFDTAGIRTTAASGVFADRVPMKDAYVVTKLRAAGAVFLGKLNLHEFAYGGSGVVSYYGPVRNPWDTSRTTGGSSSGSAAAVATGMCFAALGTDTAGSIRLPSAFCGITGLKPTYGMVSTGGVIPLSWSYDHVGPMTRTALDNALLLDVIAGFDQDEPTSSYFGYQPVSGKIEELPSGLRLGIAGGIFLGEMDPEVETAYKMAVQQVSSMLQTVITPLEIPVEQSPKVRVGEPYAYHAPMLRAKGHLYQPQTLQRILAGEGISAADYVPKKRDLDMLRRSALALFRNVDLIASPTVPCLPYAIDELVKDQERLRARELHMLRNTRPFNALGLPTISVPCGISPQGLPIGLQLAAAPAREQLLLQVAHAFEKQTKWPERLPVKPK